MLYGNTWTTDPRSIDLLISATKALGVVLSTPTGVTMLEELDLAMFSAGSARKDYEAMVDAGKRPTKAREDARAKYESYGGEEYALMNAMAYMVVEASDYTTSYVAARRTIRYELEAIEAVDWKSQPRRDVATLRRRCCNLVFGQ